MSTNGESSRSQVRQLTISPVADAGWCVSDPSRNVPPTFYAGIDQAREEAEAYLALHGGGELRIADADNPIAIAPRARRPG